MLLLTNFSKIAVVQRNLSNSSKSALADEKLPAKKSSILLPQDAPAAAAACAPGMWGTPSLLQEGTSNPSIDLRMQHFEMGSGKAPGLLCPDPAFQGLTPPAPGAETQHSAH